MAKRRKKLSKKQETEYTVTTVKQLQENNFIIYLTIRCRIYHRVTFKF